MNTTRKSGHKEFAPSWALLGPMLDIRKAGMEPSDTEWKVYVTRYLKERTLSRKRNRAVWDALLARRRVVLTCYCTNPNRCHRRILARILAQLGALDHGELE